MDLYCSSHDLITSFGQPTVFCVISGNDSTSLLNLYLINRPSFNVYLFFYMYLNGIMNKDNTVVVENEPLRNMTILYIKFNIVWVSS